MKKRVKMRGWVAFSRAAGEAFGPVFTYNGLEYLRRLHAGNIGGKYGIEFRQVLVTEIPPKAKAKKKGKRNGKK